MIPPFDEHGNLPPGVHWATWEELAERFGYGSRRRILLAGLDAALELLARARCETVYIDGSFITTEVFPRDIDVVWKTQGVNYRVLDRVFLARKKDRAAQLARFRCEFFSTDLAEADTGLPFLEYFQRDEFDVRKGIIALDPRRLP